MATDLPLNDCQVDLWCVHSEHIVDARLFDEYRQRLPKEEVSRADRFVLERSRQESLITRMLVRTVLSHYTGHDIGAWRFARGAHGKPSVAWPAGVPLEFNLSHADGLVVCAVTGGCEVGVDAENLNRKTDHLALARRYFAPAEAAAIEHAPPKSQAALFLRFWTLKEAFIKARGLGLSIPLAHVAFSLADDRPPTICFGERIHCRPEDWQFAELLITASHQVALSARIPARRRLVVRVREGVPLRWQSDARVLASSDANRWSI